MSSSNSSSVVIAGVTIGTVALISMIVGILLICLCCCCCLFGYLPLIGIADSDYSVSGPNFDTAVQTDFLVSGRSGNIDFARINPGSGFELAASYSDGSAIVAEFRDEIGADCKAYVSNDDMYDRASSQSRGAEIKCNTYIFSGPSEVTAINPADGETVFTQFNLKNETYGEYILSSELIDISVPVKENDSIYFQSASCRSVSGGNSACIYKFTPVLNTLQTFPVASLYVMPSAQGPLYKKLVFSPDGNYILVPFRNTSDNSHGVTILNSTGSKVIGSTFTGADADDWEYSWRDSNSYEVTDSNGVIVESVNIND